MGIPADTGPADESDGVRAGARFPSAKQLARMSAEEPETESRGWEVEESRSAGRPSGARFPSDQQLDRHTGSGDASWPEPADLPEPAAGTTSESTGPDAIPTEPVMTPVRRATGRPPAQRRSAEGHRPAEEPDEVAGPRVRPYVLTGGRTQSVYELRLETMVSLRSDAKWEGTALNAEYQPVRALCATPRSVAEVAANLTVPIGVARVLLSDMADLGLMHIHGTERTAEGRPPMALMRRVLDGLQRL
ncbi:MAG TPA: DUF742 domain-containing protein [Amycolatopsis sp.]|nr:DUF742 domain-containing protein [Amycolatopsis sp.]